MEIRQLKMFCAVAETGSLVGATQKLHLTNSAISHSLKELEAQLGCRLFERMARKMVLNQAGEQLLAAVTGPLAGLEAAAESLKHLGKWGQTRLRVGAADSICQHILPGVVRELKKSHAQLELRIEVGDSSCLVEQLHENKIDLAICLAPENRAGLQLRPLFRDELMFVFAAAHPWTTARRISREELRTQSFIFHSPSSFSARSVLAFFRSVAVVPRAWIEVGNVEAIKEMVKLNLGVGILSPWVADKDLATGSLLMRPIAAKPLNRRWVMLCLSGRRLNLAQEDFIKLCRRHATVLRLDRKDLPNSAVQSNARRR
jgi:DNA-binding transcriptional LysR family regulator